MNGQYFEERSNPSNFVERTDESTNSPIVNSDPFEDKVPVDAALIHETPMGGTVASISPMNEPMPEVVPMFETPLQEIPMGGTVAPVGPMNETVVREDRMGDTVPYDAMMREPSVEKPQASTSIPYMAPMGGTIPNTGQVREPFIEESRVSNPIPYMAPVGAAVTHEPSIDMNAGASAALLTREETELFRTRWNEIQGKFVDEPRSAVQQADALVSEVSAQITQMFAREHSALEGQWNRGNDVSTEDLRMALQRYRSFFNRLMV
jgi:hypothetical protein